MDSITLIRISTTEMSNKKVSTKEAVVVVVVAVVVVVVRRKTRRRRRKHHLTLSLIHSDIVGFDLFLATSVK